MLYLCTKLTDMTKVICFMNNKGGVGKTTSAHSIGLAWAKMGKRILFIDLDSQANLTSIISDTDPLRDGWERTIEDAFVAGADSGLPIRKSSDPMIDFVPSDLSLSDFDKFCNTISFKELLLLDLLEPVKAAGEYDFIIIDCPPALGTLSYNAMVASDFVVLVANPDGLSYKGVQMVISLYNEIVGNKRFNPSLQIAGLLVTRYERDTVSNVYLKRFMSELPGYVIEPVIRKSTKVKQASSINKSIYEMDEGGKVAKDYLEASMDLFVRVGEQRPEYPVE